MLIFRQQPFGELFSDSFKILEAITDLKQILVVSTDLERGDSLLD